MADYSGGTPQRVVLRLLVEFGKIPGYKTPNQVFFGINPTIALES